MRRFKDKLNQAADKASELGAEAKASASKAMSYASETGAPQQAAAPFSSPWRLRSTWVDRVCVALSASHRGRELGGSGGLEPERGLSQHFLRSCPPRRPCTAA